MTNEEIRHEYFEWMFHIVCDGRYGKENSYRELLAYLHEIEFTWIIPKDSNRAEDGKSLRWRFAYSTHTNVYDALDGPCSVLEMILALAIRCEESLLDDPSYGDRTGQWFWKMIANLGLGSMTDQRFDQDYVDDAISRFLNREYEADGRGGLFTVRNCGCDLRDVEIWNHAMWFIDSIM